MRFRADIEGLRALAITSVVVFHYTPSALPLGYLGVDVFFVLSGFLITSILLAQLQGGDFRLIEFYRRRAVRILPALLFMLILVCASGPLLLLPGEVRALALSGAAAAGFVANFLFWSSSGYFAASVIRPLLHTWSLGVEEQYYLLYPLLLMAVHRWAAGKLRLVLWVICFGSLVLWWFVGRDHPAAAFFLLPTRGWELVLGGIVAAGGFPRLGSAFARGLTAGFGLLVIAGALLGSQAFGQVASVTACIGVALLLAYGDSAPTAGLLGVAPLCWLGRISYSLYLWHLPVRELYRASSGDPSPGPLLSLALLGAVVAIALLSYHFVETPIRQRYRADPAPAVVVRAALASAGAVALACLALAFAAPRLWPLPPAAARIAAYADYRRSATWRYQFGPVECRGGTLRYDVARCLRIDPARRNILVLGDSHAAHVWRAIAERFPRDNVMLAASTRCRPLFDAVAVRLCGAMVESVRRQAIGPGRVQAVVLAGHWTPDDLAALAPTIAEIRRSGATVTVFGSVNEYRAEVPRQIAKQMAAGRPVVMDWLRAPWPAQGDSQMRPLVEGAGGRFYSMYAQECPSDHCRLFTRSGVPFHFDHAHLTLDGARELVAALPEP